MVSTLQGKLWSEPRITPAGDRGLCVTVGAEIAAEVNRALRGLILELERNRQGIVDIIPSYTNLLILYDPLVRNYGELEETLRRAWEQLGTQAQLEGAACFDIPTLYGGEYGPDMERVARCTGLDEEEIVRRHANRPYLIYFIGFSPGYPYLGGLDPELATPRLEVPRTRITPGSVGIGGTQTGVYPQASPGGWNIIGRTPAILYDPRRDPPTPYRAGDYLRFVPVAQSEFEELNNRAKRGELELRREVVEQ